MPIKPAHLLQYCFNHSQVNSKMLVFDHTEQYEGPISERNACLPPAGHHCGVCWQGPRGQDVVWKPASRFMQHGRVRLRGEARHGQRC